MNGVHLNCLPSLFHQKIGWLVLAGAVIGIAITIIGITGHLTNISKAYAFTAAGSLFFLSCVTYLAIYSCISLRKKPETLFIQKEEEVEKKRDSDKWQFKTLFYESESQGLGWEERPYLTDILANQAAKQLDETKLDSVTEMMFSKIGGLGECHCATNNRHKIALIRKEFEDRVVKNLIRLSHEREEMEITLLATGYLFGEFVLFIKFLNWLKENNWVGNLTLNLIDPINKHFGNKDSGIFFAIDTFEKELRFNLDKKNSLKIRVFSDTSDYVNFVEESEENRAESLISIEPGPETFKSYKNIKKNYLKKMAYCACLGSWNKHTALKFQKRHVYLRKSDEFLFVEKKRRKFFSTATQEKRSITLNYTAKLPSDVKGYSRYNNAMKTKDFSFLDQIPRSYFKIGPFHKIKFKVP